MSSVVMTEARKLRALTAEPAGAPATPTTTPPTAGPNTEHVVCNTLRAFFSRGASMQLGLIDL
jgi:hypothetical protein